MGVMTNIKRIKSGIYLVIDPSMEEEILLKKLSLTLTKQISAVQIWDNFKSGQNKVELIRKVHALCAKQKVLLLINNHWEYLKEVDIDGVHFDAIPDDFDEIRESTSRDLVFGITCENDLADVIWAAKHNIDYISFCSMFPSSSAVACEMVAYDTVKKASLIFDKMIFLAGGIYPKNIKQLDELRYDGIAVISGVMNSENPAQAIDEYYKNLNFVR